MYTYIMYSVVNTYRLTCIPCRYLPEYQKLHSQVSHFRKPTEKKNNLNISSFIP